MEFNLRVQTLKKAPTRLSPTFLTLSFTLVLAMAIASTPEPLNVTTLAGHPSAGWQDGGASVATFAGPNGLAVDAAGSLIVADSVNNVIRRIDPTGQVSTIAGKSGVAGCVNGYATEARFFQPTGVACSPNGRIYVADASNHMVRVIYPSGQVDTLAGSSDSVGSRDGIGAAAQFSFPVAIAADAYGNAYVADGSDSIIRKITPEGSVTTIAGSTAQPGDHGVISPPHTVNEGSNDGIGPAAQFYFPNGIAVDTAGNVYVADSGNQTIRKIDPSGVVTTIAGQPKQSGYADGSAIAAKFNGPNGLAVDAQGNVWIADSRNYVVRILDTKGMVSTVAGLAGVPGTNNGIGSAARFSRPMGVAIRPNGQAYVSDADNNTITLVSRSGNATTVAGAGASNLPGNNSSAGASNAVGAAARFNSPYAVAIEPRTNAAYVADTANHLIRKVTLTGEVTTVAGAAGIRGSSDGVGGVARFNNPKGIALAPDGTLWIADSGNHILRTISADGSVRTVAGVAGVPGSTDGIGTAARFNSLQGVVVASDGFIYVADYGNNAIRRCDKNGNVKTLAGSPIGVAGFADGKGTGVLFNNPTSVAIDGRGIVFVADAGNAVIRAVQLDGTVTTVAGYPGHFITKDGIGPDAGFTAPVGITADGLGNLFVVDLPWGYIRQIEANWRVTEVAGSARSGGSVDGIGSDAKLTPQGLTVDPSGDIYIADALNNTIRVGRRTFASGADASKLMNVSVLSGASTGDGVLVLGFVLTGSAAQRILIRGVGETLADFGVTDASPISDFELFSSTGRVVSTPWNSVAGSAAIFGYFGAFPLPTSSRDTVIVNNLSNGLYTVQTQGSGTGKSVLLEAYSDHWLQFVNASGRAEIAPKGNLILGFSISGDRDKRILIRGVASGLSKFGINQFAQNPLLAIFDSNGMRVASTASWSGNPNIVSMAAQVGAFPIEASDGDVVLSVILSPGTYTLHLTNSGRDKGLALLELYDVN
jgi:sugar lactone lactonase YvrE